MARKYPIPEKQVETEIAVSNSRFIATVGPAFSTDEAKEFIKQIQRKYADATHHVPAFIIGHGNSTVAYCSDDGEPAGSSGRPVLSVLQGSDIGDIAMVVTRYFGGTKLGIGGLVRAYGDAAKAALAILPLAEKVPTCTAMITIPYALFERTKILLKNHRAKIVEEEYGADVSVIAIFSADLFPAFNADLVNLSRGQVHAQVIEENPETIMPFGAFAE